MIERKILYDRAYKRSIRRANNPRKLICFVYGMRCLFMLDFNRKQNKCNDLFSTMKDGNCNEGVWISMDVSCDSFIVNINGKITNKRREKTFWEN